MAVLTPQSKRLITTAKLWYLVKSTLLPLDQVQRKARSTLYILPAFLKLEGFNCCRISPVQDQGLLNSKWAVNQDTHTHSTSRCSCFLTGVHTQQQTTPFPGNNHFYKTDNSSNKMSSFKQIEKKKKKTQEKWWEAVSAWQVNSA